MGQEKINIQRGLPTKREVGEFGDSRGDLAKKGSGIFEGVDTPKNITSSEQKIAKN